MTVQLDHVIIHATAPARSAAWLARVLGRPEPVRRGPFVVVALDNGVLLDFAAARGPIVPGHFAFLIRDAVFDDVLARVRADDIPFFADPWQREPGAINRRDGGRGFYFADPDGHDLEVLTRRYGNGEG